LLGINVKWITSEKDIKTLYTPTNSQADIDELKIKSMFPDRSHDEFYFHQLSDLGHYGSVIFTVDDNIINQTYKTERLAVSRRIQGFNIFFRGYPFDVYSKQTIQKDCKAYRRNWISTDDFAIIYTCSQKQHLRWSCYLVGMFLI
jgi:hypothetical protein